MSGGGRTFGGTTVIPSIAAHPPKPGSANDDDVVTYTNHLIETLGEVTDAITGVHLNVSKKKCTPEYMYSVCFERDER